MTLEMANSNQTYTVKEIRTPQSDINDFLSSLGCFPGEKIILESKQPSNVVINVKNVRYYIDKELASAISLEECENETTDYTTDLAEAVGI